MMSPFTDDPTQAPTVVFPNPGMQALSSVIHLLGVTVLSYCFARRTTFPDFTWGQLWSTITWPRLCVILVLADSWVFVFLSGVLIMGSGLSSSHTTCSLGIFACIALYAGSKVLTYAFLIEKVHVVWGGAHQPRLKSPVYRICLITMMPYAMIVILMLIGRIALLRSDGACVIGLKRLASLSLLIYDLYINVFLTAMFIWPLARSKLINPRLRSVASRTLIAAFAALTTSTVNIAILTVMHGQQLGWVCLGSCGTDVTLNAIVLFWVTSPTPGAALTHSGPQPTVNITTALDPNQPQTSFIAPPPSPRRATSAIMLSPAPRSPMTPGTPSFAEKKYEGGFLSPVALKTKFNLVLGNGARKAESDAHSDERGGLEMETNPRIGGSPRREAWDDRPSSFVMVGDLDQSRVGPGYVTIGAPPPSKKRSHGRKKTRSGVEVSQSGGRNSILGRMFGNTEPRDRDMEVTVTITTQFDHTEDMEIGSRTSFGDASVGGSIMKPADGGSTHEGTSHDRPGNSAEP
ncbi:hypothetical protein BDV93DRAFT_517688 [Ceratobasidium sp. AG-I]|nr:hypothetical protein BDV93DRAFT_517688 [Ceratobasidium sp. AG-I]